jgi:type VI secretion system protein ImpL
MHVIYLITGVSLTGYLVAAWVAGKMLGLKDSEFYILWGLLAALGTLAAGAFVWWKMRSKENDAEDESDAAVESPSDSEVELLVRDAETKLAASRLAQGSKLGNLPLLFVMGEQGSTKTTVLVHSGLEPELLAGQVYQDNGIAPTRSANLWFANGTIFTEITPAVASDSNTWTRVVRRLKPRTLKSVVGGNAQAPRAALVCVNAEVFTQQGASDVLTALGRSMQARLGQISETLGISFPVYVLFTRCDRLPFFADYVHTLTNEEAAQPLGVTLPMRAGNPGVYAEEENQRLSAAFNQLFHSLADHRVDFLPRETDGEKVPGAFEFPREFRKMRVPLVQFLIDLCRPSQLRTSPFLRGFYFCGVRPITVQEAPPPTASTQAPRGMEAAGSATGVFRLPTAAAPQPAAAQPQYVGTKRVPQWLFLNRLFNHVILQDRVALSASGASTKTSTVQRILLGAASLLLLAIAIGFTVSFFRNRSIVNDAVDASTALSNAGSMDASGPAVADLQRLASLRKILEQLTDYRINGRPFSMGWGLYAGDDLYPAIRGAYYKRFAQLLFGHAQGALKAHLDALPASPGPNDDYGTSYDSLKGYLITTSHSNRASAESPAPILLRKWSETRNIQDNRKELAQAEFQFYASDLKNGNPYSTIPNTESVERARDYLNQFSGTERVYQFMLSSAAKKTVNFNRDIPGSSQAVLNNRDVAGAFTKAGYDFMAGALQKADKFFGGEQWVLERTRKDTVDTAKLGAELSARYVKDFIAAWRAYFKNTAVLRYSGLPDAAEKLNLQTGTQSPILGVFWLASQNTGVDYSKIPGADAIRKAFQPVYRVVPPGNPERYSAPANKPYTDGLLSLQQSVDAAKSMPAPDGSAIIGAAANAKMAVKQMALEFDIDPEARLNATVQKLLEDPIISAEDLVKSLGPKELNGKGKAFCDTFDTVFRKLPFNPNGTADASLQEVSALLKPGEGALWQFYQANLQKGLVKVGSDYKPNGELPLTPAFVNFFNNAAHVSEAFFKSGADPRLSYTVRALKSEGLQNLTLVLDGQPLDAAGGQAKQFLSPGPAQSSHFTGKASGNDLQPITNQTGLWSAFKLLNKAERAEPAGSGYNLEWSLQTQVTFGGATVTGASGPTARFFVDLGGANVLLKKAGGGLNCVRQVAK